MGSLFASVFVWDSDSRVYFRGFVNSDIIRAIRTEMDSPTGIIADRLSMALERWESLLRAAGVEEGRRKGQLTSEANSIRNEIKKWVNQSKDGFPQGAWVCTDCTIVTDWDGTVRAISLIGPGNILAHCEHGYHHGRNREGAMICQEALLGRLRSLGISTVTSKEDMSNAFGCSIFPELRRTVEESIAGPDQAFFHHRHEYSTFTITGADGDLTLHNRCGAFMGDSPAADFFRGRSDDLCRDG